MNIEKLTLIPAKPVNARFKMSSFRCGKKCHYKYDDGSECSGVCNRLGDETHEGDHVCSYGGTNHRDW